MREGHAVTFVQHALAMRKLCVGRAGSALMGLVHAQFAVPRPRVRRCCLHVAAFGFSLQPSVLQKACLHQHTYFMVCACVL
jgi:hypothetical protein